MTFETINLLKGTAGSATNNYCNLLGYSQPGDGGGGDFYWDPASNEADDGGIIFQAPGVGRWKRLFTGAVYVRWFGAKGNGIADDTQAIQKAINSPASTIVAGENKTYKTTGISLKSNIHFKDFKLLHSGGSTDFSSALAIIGTTDAKSNIFIENVFIDGNRDSHTSINATSEDGGRHGLRCIGFVKDLTIKNFTAQYCATDGIEFFSGGPQPDGNGSFKYTFENLQLENVTCKWNRRHGISADCTSVISICNSQLNFNGLDTSLAAGKPDNHGSKGDRINGMLYGNGVDFEGYGNGTNIVDLTMNNVKAQNNATCGIQFLENSKTAVNEATWVAWERIKIVNCFSDYGQFALASFGQGTKYLSAIKFAGNQVYDTFKDILISNCSFKGNFLFLSCSKLTITNNNCTFIYNQVGPDERPNQFIYCKNILIRDFNYECNFSPMLIYSFNCQKLSYESSFAQVVAAASFFQSIPSYVQDLRAYQVGNTVKFYIKLSNLNIQKGDIILSFNWWAKYLFPYQTVPFYKVGTTTSTFMALISGGEVGAALVADSSYNFLGNAVSAVFEIEMASTIFS